MPPCIETPTAEATRTGVPRRRGPGRRTATLLVLVAGLALACIALLRRDPGNLDGQIAAIRAAGEPLFLEDFIRAYRDPDPSRDFDVFLDGLGMRPSELDEPDYHPKPQDAGLTPEARAYLERNVATNRPAIDAFLAADLATYRKPFHRTKGWLGMEARVFTDIDLAKALDREIILAGETGDAGRAAACIEQGLRMARLSIGGGIIGGIGNLACERIVLRGAPRAFDRLSFTDAQLARLSRVFTRPGNPLREALLVERGLQSWIRSEWSHVLDVTSMSASRPMLGHLLRLQPPRRMRANSLREWTAYVASASLPARERLAVIGGREKDRWGRTLQQRPLLAQLAALANPGRLIDALVKPRLMQYVEDDLNLEAILANARAVVALERWRLAHGGALPEFLEQLVPDFLPGVPGDPFDLEHPVRFRTRSNGYTVYSIGSDFDDDGGRDARNNADGDVAWSRRMDGTPHPGR